jgi:hypothetical protein
MIEMIRLENNYDAYYYKKPTKFETVGQNAVPNGIFTEYNVTIKNRGNIIEDFKVFQNLSGDWLNFSWGSSNFSMINEFKYLCEKEEIRKAKKSFLTTKPKL